MPKISIVVPIYNVEKYLEQCLQSLYELEIDKEIILVNDESPDESYKLIEKYKNLYPTETLIVNKKNGGLSSARNAGLKVATGEYISFIDSDDWVDTEKYQDFIKKVILDNVDIGLGNTKYYYDSTEEYGETFFRGQKIKDEKIKTGEQYIIDSFEDSLRVDILKVDSLRVEVCDDMYKRRFLLDNKLLFKEGLLHEDQEFTMKVLVKASEVKYYDIPFYLYRQREGSIMHTTNIKNDIDLSKIARMILKNIDGNKEKEINHIIYFRAYFFYKESMLKIHELDREKFKEIYKKYKEDYKSIIKRYNKKKNILFRIESIIMYHNFNLAKSIIDKKRKNK
ncbi:MAG: glycosyltransferase [Fusobacteriaceae bacterium]